MPAPSLTLETVPCNLCQSTDLETVFDARAHLEKDPELAVKFRASSDELLTQPLVRCRQCSLLFVNPRIPAAAMLGGYAAGDDTQYVSQMRARVRTFAGALSHINRLKPAKGHCWTSARPPGLSSEPRATMAGRRWESSRTAGSPSGAAPISAAGLRG